MSQAAMAHSSGPERPWLCSRLRLEHLWMGVPVIAVVWMALLNPLRLLDFWWHLKAGQVILASRSIPTVDLFSYTRAGQPFVVQNWLGEVLYAVADAVGGLPLLIAWNAVLAGAAIAWIVCLCHESGAGWRLATCAALPCALVLGLYSNVRPQVYSFALFACFTWVLSGFRERRRDRLWWLPVLMVLWSNLHGAFVLGILLVALTLGTEGLCRLHAGARGTLLSPAALGKLALVLALVLLASLVNPQGYKVYSYVRQLQVDPASQQLVAEWQVPDIKKVSGLLLFYLPLFLTLLVILHSRRRLDLTETGWYLAFLGFGLSAMRNAIWFSLIAAPLMARQLTGIDARDMVGDGWIGRQARALQGWLARHKGRRVARPLLNWALLGALVVFTVMVSPWARPRLRGETGLAALVDRQTPVGAMEFIASHGLTGHIFHPQNCGDYLIWRLWPQQRSFIDGRVHLYDLPFVRDYIAAFQDEQWESRLAKYDVQYLLLPRNDANCAQMIRAARDSERWTLLYEDERWVLFEQGA